MTSKPKLVCWDSCVIIDYLQQTTGRHEMINPMVEQAEKGGVKIVVSEISVAEVCKLKDLEGVSVADQVNLIEDWFERPYVVVRVVDRGVSSLASRLQRNHSIKTCDAVILATAIKNKIETLYTYDGHAEDGQPPKNGKLIKLDGIIPVGDEATLRIVAPEGRADGQTSIADILVSDAS